MNILITAGGTTEPIDSVRSISNTSTGKLGSLIAKAYEKIDEINKIYYVCGKNSIVPQSAKVEVIVIDTVASLEIAIRSIIQADTIDIIIHCMAVSDYRVKAVTSASMLSDTLSTKLGSLNANQLQVTEEFIMSLFQESVTSLNHDGKISSNINNLLLCMEKTPKIISLFRTIAPNAILVGFKLLDRVPLDELIDTAFQVLQDNKCSFVLANDLQDISAEQHIGYLIDEHKAYKKCVSKIEIADLIVLSTIDKRGKKQ